MPTYCYKCNDCNHNFEVKHSMNFSDQKCLECESYNIFKIPSISIYKNMKNVQPVGKIVDDFIKNTKDTIKKEKQIMKSESL